MIAVLLNRLGFCACHDRAIWLEERTNIRAGWWHLSADVLVIGGAVVAWMMIA